MRQYLHWKTYLVLFALAIVSLALYYFSSIVRTMEEEEKKRVQIVVEGIQTIATASYTNIENDITFASKVVTENTNIPLIITDEEGNILGFNNLDSIRISRHAEYLDNKLKTFASQHAPLEVDYQTGKNYVYFGDSNLLSQLRYYPLVLLTVIFVFIVIVMISVSNAQKSIQNQVWVGMSKETAHQLGTPLSSIVAWMELLKEREENKEWVLEMEKDVERLQLIADRFSKIGSVPQLEEENLTKRLQSMVNYMAKRSPMKVDIQFLYEEEDVRLLLSGPLFDWVIENLIRNALDAMEGKGLIKIVLKNTPRQVFIDIKDTGKGIPKYHLRKVFSPGFSTKRRGWGLGLSLAKRIIEQYHGGTIFVKHSEVGIGTAFRIVLYR